MDIADITTWQIIKWVLIVLVAAFIGQFGKTFAQYLMNRFGRKKAVGRGAESTVDGMPTPEANQPRMDTLAGEDSLKAEKKESKALLKAKKKENKNR